MSVRRDQLSQGQIIRGIRRSTYLQVAVPDQRSATMLASSA
jgi:hypothetical protein